MEKIDRSTRLGIEIIGNLLKIAHLTISIRLSFTDQIYGPLPQKRVKFGGNS